MNNEEIEKVLTVLKRLKASQWTEILDNLPQTGQLIKAAKASLKAATGVASTKSGKYHNEVVTMYDYRLLSDSKMGPQMRGQILRSVPKTKWKALNKLFRELKPGGVSLDPRCTQGATGSSIMADYWKNGSEWSKSFCEGLNLPLCLATSKADMLRSTEVVTPAVSLKALHDYQEEAYEQLRALLARGGGVTAMLSLPTGAGKTRVAVDAICDHMAERLASSPGCTNDIVLWIARTNELLTQTWESFREVWQVPPMKNGGRDPVRRSNPMKIVRAWGTVAPASVLKEIEMQDDDTVKSVYVVIAGVSQLLSWVKSCPDFFDTFKPKNGRLCCCVVDEAHGLITHDYGRVFESLGLKKKSRWESPVTAPLVLGLSATPWKHDTDDTQKLKKYFQLNLVRPEILKNEPIARLESQGILAKAKWGKLTILGTPGMTPKQVKMLEQFRDIPSDYLRMLGEEHKRNALILAEMTNLHPSSKVLVFTCSVAHATILTLMLDAKFGSGSSASISGETPRAQRISTINRFRSCSEFRFLCNYGVLTTGFDAPKVDVVCITRPTMSAVLYEQMVGRGLRGPKNGGTEECIIIDVQDEGLPSDIQSYGRVLHQWT